MKLSVSAPLLLAGVACAELLVIPQVSRYVGQIQSKYSQYLDPPTATATSEHAKATYAHKIAPVNKAPASQCSYWMENIDHQGIAAFNSNSSYIVFRNVKDYGAKGDGQTDDSLAIQMAIEDGNRFGPSGGLSSTNTPAVVYFPSGTYVISSPIIDYYYTQIIGNPNCLPVIVPSPTFTGSYLIDGDENRGFTPSTIIFYRQIRNLILDMTTLPPETAIVGINWPTAQATSLQNIVFQMSDHRNTKMVGVAMVDGSGGFLNDLVFHGGLRGMMVGNQQFTMRNLTFTNVVTAIVQTFDWGWTYHGIKIHNCTTGLQMTTGGAQAQTVSSVIFIDSVISQTAVGFRTAHVPGSQPPSAGSLILENVVLHQVPIAVQDTDGSIALAGTTNKKKTKNIAAWAQGHTYDTTGGPKKIEADITPNPRPASLLSGTSYYTRSKPQYETIPATSFTSVRDAGAVGDGITDDTTAIQNAINAAVSAGTVLFFDAGTYRVTKTILIPAGSRVVGESYSVIMSSGSYFNKLKSPQPVVRVGKAGGQAGVVEWSDMIVATQGPQVGAILIEWNMISPSGTPSGMWDVHARVGGFVGSNLSLANCPAVNTTKITDDNYKKICVSGYLTMHVTPPASGLYMENNWLWTADHDLDTNATLNQITVYNGRGFHCESAKGPVWMWGTGVEHHQMYQYQFVNTKNVFISQAQSETPYYQPNPPATIPFKTNAALNDPVFRTAPYKSSQGDKIPNADAWGLRVLDSKNILVYGAGHYSFFNNYGLACNGNNTCQSRIVSLESSTSTVPKVYLYDLHTVGTYVMISLKEGSAARNDVATYAANKAGFPDEIAVFKPT